MKITELIGKGLDWTGKNIGRIKTIGLIIIVVLFFISFVNNGCNRAELSRIIERTTGLNIQNDILNHNILERDSIILLKDARIALMQDSLKLLQEESSKLKLQYTHLEGDYRDLSKELIFITTDSSYSFLTHVAYPYEGELRYPFNEPQVKGMHLTYLEKISLEGLNANLSDQITGCENQLALRSDMAEETESEMMLMKETRNDLENIIDNKDEIIQVQDKELRKNKNRKTFWKATTGVASILLLVVLL